MFKLLKIRVKNYKQKLFYAPFPFSTDRFYIHLTSLFRCGYLYIYQVLRLSVSLCRGAQRFYVVGGGGHDDVDVDEEMYVFVS